MADVLVPISEGFEEIETATLVDVMRRAGIRVTLAGLAGSGPCKGSREIDFVPDADLDDVLDQEWDLVALPGGAGNAARLAEDDRIQRLLRQRVAEGRPVAAICAGPAALDAAGVLPEGNYTCYPGWEKRLRTPGRRDERVVDGGLVWTSQGPATAMEFGLFLVEKLCGPARREEVARGLLAPT